MEKLPSNGDKVITECPNCENHFEDSQEMGTTILCDSEDGGCGFKFKILAVKSKLTKED